MNILFIGPVSEDAKEDISTIRAETTHEVKFSKNPADAIAGGEVSTFDIIVLELADLEFPEHMRTGEPEELRRTFGNIRRYDAGIQTLFEIKKKNPDQKVIVAHCSPWGKTNAYCKELGANEVLKKPYDMDDFLGIIERMQ